MSNTSKPPKIQIATKEDVIKIVDTLQIIENSNETIAKNTTAIKYCIIGFIIVFLGNVLPEILSKI